MIREFGPNDYKTLCKWWDGWGAEIVPEQDLPKTGFISDGAAAFLVNTDSGFCFIETLVNNPAMEKHERNNATDAIIEHCIAYSAGAGQKKMFALTNNRFVVERALKHCFTWNNCFVLMERGLK